MPVCRWSLRCLPTSGRSRRQSRPDLGQLVARSHARQQQQLRGADGPGREHDLTGGGHGLDGPVRRAVLDAGGDQPVGAVLQQHALHVRVRHHHEVLAGAHHRLEEGVEGRGPLAVLGGGLEQRRDALGAQAVAPVVVAGRDAGRRRGVDELLRRRHDGGAHGDAERALGVVRVVVDDDVAAGLEALGLLEVGEHLGVRPALRAAVGPGVEVARVAAHVGHVVDPRGAAEHLAPRDHHAAADQPLADPARVALVHPVGRRVVLQGRDRRRHELRRRRRTARLEQRDPDGRVLGQAGGDDRSGRPSADDDDVELLAHACLSRCRGTGRPARWSGSVARVTAVAPGVHGASVLGLRPPQVDAALDRVLVDLGQLLGREVQPVERRDVLLELRDAARADDQRGHPLVAQRPGEGHLRERLAPALRDAVSPRSRRTLSSVSCSSPRLP